jgi:hypothetical protein
VELADGEWAAVPHVEGALVVNAGDLLHRWTNGERAGSLHLCGLCRLSFLLCHACSCHEIVRMEMARQAAGRPRSTESPAPL